MQPLLGSMCGGLLAVQTVTLTAGAIVFMCVAVPFVLPVLAPLVISFVYIRKRYIMTSRKVCLLGLRESHPSRLPRVGQ